MVVTNPSLGSSVGDGESIDLSQVNSWSSRRVRRSLDAQHPKLAIAAETGQTETLKILHQILQKLDLPSVIGPTRTVGSCRQVVN